MALTNRKITLYPPLNKNGSRYIVARPKGMLNDYHLHFFILTSITPEDQKLIIRQQQKNVVLPLNTLYNMLNWQQINCEKELENLVERLMERKLYIVEKEQKHCWNFFATINYDNESIKFTINWKIIEYMLWLQDYWGKKNYSRIDFAATHQFLSVYSEIIYNRIINSADNQLLITVDDFKQLVWAIAPSYSDIRNLKQKVITPILNDINKFTNYTLALSQHYQGRTTTHLQFSWTIKT